MGPRSLRFLSNQALLIKAEYLVKEIKMLSDYEKSTGIDVRSRGEAFFERKILVAELERRLKLKFLKEV